MNIIDMLSDFAAKFVPPTVELKPGEVHAMMRDQNYTPQIVDLRIPAKVHGVDDVASLLAYLGRHGRMPTTTVFCHSDAFTAVIDDSTVCGGGADRDRVVYTPTDNDNFAEWKNAFGKKISHVDFRNFIEDHKADLIDRQILAAVKGFRVRQVFEYDGNLDTGRQIGLKATTNQGKAKGASDVVELPREFSINTKILVGWDRSYELKIRLEAEFQDGKVSFKIEARNLASVMDALMNDLVGHVREQLGDGWLVVRGKPKLAADASGNASGMAKHRAR